MNIIKNNIFIFNFNAKNIYYKMKGGLKTYNFIWNKKQIIRILKILNKKQRPIYNKKFLKSANSTHILK